MGGSNFNRREWRALVMFPLFDGWEFGTRCELVCECTAGWGPSSQVRPFHASGGGGWMVCAKIVTSIAGAQMRPSLSNVSDLPGVGLHCTGDHLLTTTCAAASTRRWTTPKKIFQNDTKHSLIMSRSNCSLFLSITTMQWSIHYKPKQKRVKHKVDHTVRLLRNELGKRTCDLRQLSPDNNKGMLCIARLFHIMRLPSQAVYHQSCFIGHRV